MVLRADYFYSLFLLAKNVCLYCSVGSWSFSYVPIHDWLEKKLDNKPHPCIFCRRYYQLWRSHTYAHIRCCLDKKHSRRLQLLEMAGTRLGC